MARIRTIKPEFWSDEKLSPMDPTTRLVFLALISMADDCGRLLDNLKIIDAWIFPETSETARESLANLSRIGRIRRGITSSGQRVIQIVNWERHQKVDKPNLSAALPEVVEIIEDTGVRDSLANRSRIVREPLATHTNDLLPTTNDLRPTTNDQRAGTGRPEPPKGSGVKRESGGGFVPDFIAVDCARIPDPTPEELARRDRALSELAEYRARRAAAAGAPQPPASDLEVA